MRKSNPWIASLLTFLTIGLGHIYIGAGGRGILLFIVSFSLSYLAVLAGTPDQLIFTFSLIVGTGIACYTYAIIDVLKILPHLADQQPKWYSKWYVFFLLYLINSIFFSPILSKTFTEYIGTAYVIRDESMHPTAVDGDHVLVTETVQNTLQHGDIVTFTMTDSSDETTYIKRVAAMAGETVTITNGLLYINSNPVDEKYLFEGKTETGKKGSLSDFPQTTVPPGSVFVLGDNRNNSYDSRSFGSIPKENVTGVAQNIYWSWDKDKRSVRWKRINQGLN